MYKTDPTSTYSHSHNVQDRSYNNLQPLPLCTRQTLHQPTASPAMYKTDPTIYSYSHNVQDRSYTNLSHSHNVQDRSYKTRSGREVRAPEKLDL